MRKEGKSRRWKRGGERAVRLRVCEEGYLYSDRFPIIGGTNDRESAPTERKIWTEEGREEGESVRDRDSSLGSHVLSQFTVSLSPRRSFFAPLSRPVAQFLLRFVTRFSLPLLHSLTPPRGVEASRPPRILRAKTCMRTRRHVWSVHLKMPEALRVVCDRVLYASLNALKSTCGAEFNREYIISSCFFFLKYSIKMHIAIRPWRFEFLPYISAFYFSCNMQIVFEPKSTFRTLSMSFSYPTLYQ